MKEVVGTERENFLFIKTGSIGAMALFESNIYSRARKWDKEYTGGYWKYYDINGLDKQTELPVKAWFMAFEDDKEMTAQCYYGEVTTDSMTWSVALNLVMFGSLSFYYHDLGDDRLTELYTVAYHNLKNAALGKLIPDLDIPKLLEIID